MIAIGAVRSPHGLRGGVKVHTFSGETEHFKTLVQVELRNRDSVRRMTVNAVEIHHHTPVLFFDGIETPEAARSISGWEVWVTEESAAPLGDGEFYISQLVGMAIRVAGTTVARVQAVLEGTQAPLLEVVTTSAETEHPETVRLVPFMEPFIGAVNQEEGWMELEEAWVLDTE